MTSAERLLRLSVVKGPLGLELEPHGDALGDEAQALPVIVHAATAPASDAGIQPGDVLVEVNARRVDAFDSYRALLSHMRRSRPIDIVARRPADVATAPSSPQAPICASAARDGQCSPVAPLKASSGKPSVSCGTPRPGDYERDGCGHSGGLDEERGQDCGHGGGGACTPSPGPTACLGTGTGTGTGDGTGDGDSASPSPTKQRIDALREQDNALAKQIAELQSQRAQVAHEVAQAEGQLHLERIAEAEAQQQRLAASKGVRIITARASRWSSSSSKSQKKAEAAAASASSFGGAPAPPSAAHIASPALHAAQTLLARGGLSAPEYEHIAAVASAEVAGGAASTLEADEVERHNRHTAATDDVERTHIDWSPSSPPGVILAAAAVTLPSQSDSANVGVGTPGAPSTPPAAPAHVGAQSAAARGTSGGGGGALGSTGASDSGRKRVIANYFDPAAREIVDDRRRKRWCTELLAYVASVPALQTGHHPEAAHRPARNASGANGDEHGADTMDDDAPESIDETKRRANVAFSFVSSEGSTADGHTDENGVSEDQFVVICDALRHKACILPANWAMEFEQLPRANQSSAWEPKHVQAVDEYLRRVRRGLVKRDGAGGTSGNIGSMSNMSDLVRRHTHSSVSPVSPATAQARAEELYQRALQQLCAFYFIFNRSKLDAHDIGKSVSVRQGKRIAGDGRQRGRAKTRNADLTGGVVSSLAAQSAAAVLLRHFGMTALTHKLFAAYGCAPTGWEAAVAGADVAVSGAAAGGDAMRKYHHDERQARIAEFKAAMREYQQNLLENGIIAWRRAHPEGTFAEYLQTEHSGNIKIDVSTGATVWVDPRAKHLEHVFACVRAHTPLHDVGTPPAPPELDDLDKQDEEFRALFPGGGF